MAPSGLMPNGSKPHWLSETTLCPQAQAVTNAFSDHRAISELSRS